MKMPKKYEKYNIIPKTMEQGIDIIIHDDEFLEKLEKKVKKELVPYKFKHLSDYIDFLEKVKNENKEYAKDFDIFIENLKEQNDVNTWGVAQYIFPTGKTHEFEDGTKIEPSHVRNNYYFIIYPKNIDGSRTLYMTDESERVGINYVVPVSLFELIEDPSNELFKYFNDDYAIAERKKTYDMLKRYDEKQTNK